MFRDSAQFRDLHLPTLIKSFKQLSGIPILQQIPFPAFKINEDKLEMCDQGLTVPPLQRQDIALYTTQCPMNNQIFQLGCSDWASIPALCIRFVPLMWSEVFPLPHIVPSCVYEDQYFPKYSTGPVESQILSLSICPLSRTFYYKFKSFPGIPSSIILCKFFEGSKQQESFGPLICSPQR